MCVGGAEAGTAGRVATGAGLGRGSGRSTVEVRESM